MTNGFALLPILLVPCLCFALPTGAYDAGSPDTTKKVSEAVERYYQSKPAWVRPTVAELAFAPLPTCVKPRFPRAALQDGLEGNVVISFQVDAKGRPTNASIDKSSGWAILDQAALEALSVCSYEPDESGAWQKRSYDFHSN